MKRAVIQAAPSYSRLVGPPEADRLARTVLSVEHPEARFVRRKSWGKWDGRIRFYRRGVFPTGLVPRLRQALLKDGWWVSVEGGETFPPLGEQFAVRLTDPRTGKPLRLRPYQKETVRIAVARKRAPIEMSVGSGKTEVGAEWARRLGLPTLWLVHRKDLLHQTVERLSAELGQEVGVIGDSQVAVRAVTVGSIPTLHRIWDEENKSFWGSWQALVIDECHHLKATTWYDVVMRCENAWYRLALSGTIKTGNALADMRLEAATGPTVKLKGATTAELTRKGYLPDSEVRMLRVPPDSYPTYDDARNVVFPGWSRMTGTQRSAIGKELSRGKHAAALYSECYRGGVTENKARNQIATETARKHILKGDRVLVLYTKLKHGKALFKRMSRVLPTTPVVLLSGKDSSELRLRAKQTVEREPSVIVASDIWKEGMDLPDLDVGILTGAGKAPIPTLQRAGRMLRGKSFKVIYDFLDWCGYPDEKDYLREHTKARLAAYRAAGFKVRRAG